MGRVLIIDDDADICDTMASLIGRLSHECITVQSLGAARRIIRSEPLDVIFLDVKLPDGNGLDMLPEIIEKEKGPEVIILTGRGDPDGAELAIKGGVWDYLVKPSSVREITLTLNRAMRYHRERVGRKEENEVSSSNIVGNSPEMKAALKLLAQAARSDSNLLISGETGTGKEVFARTIHENSSRKSGSFTVVDCASLTESLVESTLFGHRKGAFTGALEHQPGLIKLADRGTLFLDEIGEMPHSIQKSFLRVLQERTFRAVGEAKEQTSNFRLIAASNRDLDEMVDQGTFRSDLLYRIKTMIIHLPPLRERTGDVKVLTRYRVEQICRNLGRPVKQVSNDFLEMLERYRWPGNVRELFNLIERAIVAAGSETNLFAMHLPRSLRIQIAKEQINAMTGADDFDSYGSATENNAVRKIGQDIFQDIFECDLPSLKEFKTTVERVYISELIRQGAGDITKVLAISGLSRSHFYALLKKHNLSIQSD